jgi:hypothetical protein
MSKTQSWEMWRSCNFTLLMRVCEQMSRVK